MNKTILELMDEPSLAGREPYGRLVRRLRIFRRFVEDLSSLSTCRRKKVGCLVTTDDLSEVLSIGYNGQPVGISNDRCRSEEGRCGCVHAEANAIVKLRSMQSGLVLLCTCSPCESCAGLISNSKKVRYVLYGEDYRDLVGKTIMHSAGILFLPMDELTERETYA